LKTAWSWLFALVLSGCHTPESGADRSHYLGSVDSGAKDTCENTVCDPNATCSDTGGAPKCTCAPGFTGDGKQCEDVDECKDASLNDCDANALCVNRPGAFLCKCKDGYLGDGKTCIAVNECAAQNDVCDPNAVCADASPGFSCTCKAGFKGDGNGCGDVNECADPKLFSCPPHSACVNTFGGYDCACDPGFVGTSKNACESLCEVALADPSVCAKANAACRVDGFAATCDACAPGFVGDGKSCAASACDAACDGQGGDDAPHAVCTTGGSCACAPGWSGAVGSCKDVDECATGNGGCGDHSVCQNTDGGHVCACQPGYEKDASGACVDVDECKASTSPCHPDAVCTNTTLDAKNPHGFTCACKPGFTGDGTVCADIDECTGPKNPCSDSATCVNQRGSFACVCAPPLVGDPSNCHCDLSGVWAMRQDVDTCWKARPLQVGISQDLVSAGAMEATVWELHEITYDGTQVRVRKKGCGADNTPDLISPLFRETYSSYVPYSTFDDASLQPGKSFQQAGLVPGASFKTPSEAAVLGIDLGGDPLTTPWPPSHNDVSTWVDDDGDGEPGFTLWPRLPSQTTDSGLSKYSYLPARPGIGGGTFFIEQRAGCVSVAARVVTHLEAQVDSCTRIIGKVVNEKTEGRVRSCTLVDKGTCDPANANDCSGWKKDIGCTADDWKAATRCETQDVDRLDDNQNQVQNSNATFELVRVGNVGDAVACSDVRGTLPSLDHSVPTISCKTPQ
jgi:hypothetical protein